MPDYITSLPQTVLNTPFGQMLKPQLDSAMRSMTQAPPPPYSAPAARAVEPAVSAGAGSSLNGGIQANPDRGYGKPAAKAGLVRNAASLGELQALLHAAADRCAVVFFTSATCPPCKLVYPAYDELAADAGRRAILIKVDVGEAYDAARHFGVAATPTFVTFLHGEKENEWTGADERRLRGNVALLLQMARHPHMNLPLSTLRGTPKTPLTYAKVPPLDKLIAKMGAAGQEPIVQAVKSFIVTRGSSSAGAKEATLPDLAAFSAFVCRAVAEMPREAVFTAVDLLRVALVDARVSGYFAEESEHKVLNTVLHCCLDQPHGSSSSALSSAAATGGGGGGDTTKPYSLQLVTLQALCNMFTTPLFSTQTLRVDAPLLASLLQLLNSYLTYDANENVRIAAASLAFNIAAFISRQRVDDDDTNGLGAVGAHGSSVVNGADNGGDSAVIGASEQLQLLVSVVEALAAEQTSREALKRNLVALGFLVYCVPKDSELLDYIGAAGVAAIVMGKATAFPTEKRLIAEIGEQLLGKGNNM